MTTASSASAAASAGVSTRCPSSHQRSYASCSANMPRSTRIWKSSGRCGHAAAATAARSDASGLSAPASKTTSV
jgi:hypothetical protein